jgi:predicted O-methyltransferase YrrM
VLVVGASGGERVLAAARCVPDDGLMICVDGDRDSAREAAAAFAREGLGARVSIMTGDPALVVGKVAGPFDLILTAEGWGDRLAGALRARLAAGGRILDL